MAYQRLDLVVCALCRIVTIIPIQFFLIPSLVYPILVINWDPILLVLFQRWVKQKHVVVQISEHQPSYKQLSYNQDHQRCNKS